MIQKFQENGYNIVDIDKEISDICIVNTCTVTNIADRKSRQSLRKVKEKNKNAIIVATGCYAQSYKEELEKMKEIDLVLGNEEKKDIVNHIEEFLRLNKKIICVKDISKQKEFDELGEISYTEKTRAVIKVQDGCNQFCSYCIIPYARGRIRSRNIENIIKEIKKIAQNGIKEVVITGIHLASYGKDFEQNIGLIDLLEKINEIDGILRIRLGSLEPQIITEEFMKRLIKLNKVCHSFHLSLQSGCDETLKRMNRKYTTSEFSKITNILRKYYKDVILTTDIIVGFPGETEEEFKETYDFLEKIKFYKMHVFPYSPRRGTIAAKMPNQISGDIKSKRSKTLIELSDKNQKDYNERLLEKNVEVLFEEPKNGYIKGHTSNFILVKCKTNQNFENQIKSVKIIGAEIEDVIGEVNS